MSEITGEAFQPFIGQTFDVAEADDTPVLAQFTLKEATATSKRPFRLLFEGPASIPLGQGMFNLENADFGKLPIFIVPIRADSEIRSYEAIFN